MKKGGVKRHRVTTRPWLLLAASCVTRRALSQIRRKKGPDAKEDSEEVSTTVRVFPDPRSAIAG